MTQQDQVGSHKTVIYHNGTHTVIVYHSTAVVRFNEKEIILNTASYETRTTKLRMNQASKQYNLGYYVYQKHFVWFVEYKGKEQFFHDGIVLER